jgi:hypothetical protein
MYKMCIFYVKIELLNPTFNNSILTSPELSLSLSQPDVLGRYDNPYNYQRAKQKNSYYRLPTSMLVSFTQLAASSLALSQGIRNETGFLIQPTQHSS